jgi:phosphoribosylformylglycinamidine (FGAM) synthase-like enzyme
LVASCHDLSEGGLALALAEMALGGRLGIQADLPSGELSPLTLLFSESNGRLVVEVEAANAAAFEEAMRGVPITAIGTVSDTPILAIAVDGEPQIALPVESLVSAWLRQPLGVRE